MVKAFMGVLERLTNRDWSTLDRLGLEHMNQARDL